jgi:hypothetical protein
MPIVNPCGVALQGVFNASTDFVAAQWSGEGAGVLLCGGQNKGAVWPKVNGIEQTGQ